MARRRAHVPLNVFLNGRLVGVLHRESSGAINFQYSQEWLGRDSTFPISLSLPLREDRYIGAPVINVFDNLLPDNNAIRRRIAERIGAGGTDAYNLLAALGHDCVGALQFLADGSPPGAVGAIESVPMNDDAVAAMIGNLANAPLGINNDDDFRISIAGAQEKTALLRIDGAWFKPLGTTATTHILKPQMGQLANGVDLSNSVENEYLCLKLIEAFGVRTPPVEIANFGARRTLIVERFDRRWTEDGRLLRLPQEDMCQALSVPPTLKYQSEGGPNMRDILQLLKGSDSPDEDIATFMRACILFWMLGATDGHAKNFSVFLSPGGRFHFTPLYDVLTAQPSLDAGQIQRKQFKLAMSVGKNRHYHVDAVMPRHFLESADLARISERIVRDILADLSSTAVRKMDAVVEALPANFPAPLITSVTKAIRKRTQVMADMLP